MTATLLTFPVFRAFDSNGAPLAGGLLYSYQAGTTTPLATYVDQAGVTQNTNPVVLDSTGTANVWLGDSTYKLILKDKDGIQQWSVDNIQSEQAIVNGVYTNLANTSDVSQGDALIGVKSTLTGAVARTQHSKNADVVSVKDFGALGNGTTNDTEAIQAAINSLTGGGEVYFPIGKYLFSTLTITNSVTLHGAGWACSLKDSFGTAYAASTSGSVLISTATSGSAITHTTTNQNFRLKNIAIIGPGSGTSIGFTFGSAANYNILGKWDDVLIANFYSGLVLTNIEDYEFSSLRIRGCSTEGLTLTSGGAAGGTNTTNDTFVNFEVQKCGTGVKMTGAANINFFGGLSQGNTTGINLAPTATSGVTGILFDGMWSETNTTAITLDLTDNSMQNLAFENCIIQETGDLFNLVNPNNNTVLNLTLSNNQAVDKIADFSPGTSTGPAFAQVTLNNNRFDSIVESNAIITSIGDSLKIINASINPSLSTGSAIWAMDGNQTGISIANDGTATPFGNSNNFSGMFVINDTNTGAIALFITGNGIMSIVHQTESNYSILVDTPNKMNVYLSGSNVVTIQNKTGATSDVRVLAFRTRNSQ